MSNNKQQQKSFANIMSIEEFENLEIDEFLLYKGHKIYVLSQMSDYLNIALFKNIDSKIELQEKEEFTRDLRKFYGDEDLSWDHFYHKNPLLIEEIYDSFLKFIEKNNTPTLTINRLKIELLNGFDDEDKKNIINNNLYKYNNEFNNNILLQTYFLAHENIDIESVKMSALIKTAIDTNKNIYIDFITKGHKIEYYNYDLFIDWENLKIASGVLKFLKDYKKEHFQIITTTSITTDNNESTTNTIDIENKYYSPIFLDQDKENIFYKVLEDLNGINDKGEPMKRKFQPICDAIFNSYKEHSDKIFKYNIDTIDYIEYLKLKFPNKINSNKLSSGVNHFDKTNEMLSDYLRPQDNKI